MGRAKCCGCSTRTLVLLLSWLQLIQSVERQVFDFLAQMWGPIIFNFFSTIFTLFGIFGAYHRRPGHLSLYLLWQLVSLTYNGFVVCFYLEVGPVTRDSDFLNLGTGSRSWWEANGPHCEPQYNHSAPQFAYYEIRPVSVEGCLLPFYAIETAQASVHFALSFFALIMSMILFVKSCGKDDDSFEYVGDFDNESSLNSSRLHPMSTNSLPTRRSIKRNRQRSSQRSTASARRKRRARGGDQDPHNIYTSNNQLVMNGHYDASSLDSFNQGGHQNPLYGGSIHSTGSRFSIYTINPNATDVSIRVDNMNPHGTLRRNPLHSHRPRSPLYMNSTETMM